MGKHQLALHLDDATMRELKQEALWQASSEADIVAQALKAYLGRKSYKRAAIDEAVAKADQGEFISSEAMMAWLERLETDPSAPAPEPDVVLPHGHNFCRKVHESRFPTIERR